MYGSHAVIFAEATQYESVKALLRCFEKRQYNLVSVDFFILYPNSGFRLVTQGLKVNQNTLEVSTK